MSGKYFFIIMIMMLNQIIYSETLKENGLSEAKSIADSSEKSSPLFMVVKGDSAVKALNVRENRYESLIQGTVVFSGDMIESLQAVEMNLFNIDDGTETLLRGKLNVSVQKSEKGVLWFLRQGEVSLSSTQGKYKQYLYLPKTIFSLNSGSLKCRIKGEVIIFGSR